ncbi:Palmitoyltransferase [Spironucleus salmonicida]|uniref:Palmitoyltransferase n=1 Tax=Spironucleus salmonicida TaxID=348837 RepID=V6LFZ1_9EUKA|nr:Palmitoyltransferase [Spironucleus salmonicida]|eukprot:EST42621.1 DHHC zinc finger and transmembrane domain-containing protein [Spironucleus salmonicida]
MQKFFSTSLTLLTTIFELLYFQQQLTNLQFTISLLLPINFCVSIIRVQYFTHPQNLEMQGSKFCQFCQTSRPLQTRHCRACNLCRQRFDHHCQFLNSCVYGQNFNIYVKIYITGSIWGLFGLFVLKNKLSWAVSLTAFVQYFRGYFILCRVRFITGVTVTEQKNNIVADFNYQLWKQKLGGSMLLWLFNPFVRVNEG